MAEGPRLKFAKGGPMKRRRKEDEVPPPPAYVPENATRDALLYLPGGLMRALEGAERNRHHPLRGVAWRAGTRLVLPGDWVLRQSNQSPSTWWLIFRTTIEDTIITCKSGGYLRVTRADWRLSVLVAADDPPWWETWVYRQLWGEDPP